MKLNIKEFTSYTEHRDRENRSNYLKKSMADKMVGKAFRALRTKQFCQRINATQTLNLYLDKIDRINL